MKKLLLLLFSLIFLYSTSAFAEEVCPEGTWNRNLDTSRYGGMSTSLYGGMSTARGGGMYTGRGGGMSTARGGGMYTGLGGGLYTGRGGGLYTGRGGGLYDGPGGGLYTERDDPYCTNRPHLHILLKMGIIDLNFNIL